MKKILHISYDNSAGAGTVPMLFHWEMEKRGYYSRLLLHGRSAKKNDHVITYHSKWRVLLHQINLGIHKLFGLNGVSKYYFYNSSEKDNYISADSILEKTGFIPDIIIFYWTSRFVSTKTMAELYHSTGAKIFWVTTDMAPYTGGCHYSWECNGFEKSCDSCPAIRSPHRASDNLKLKQKNLEDIPITVVASPGDSINFVKRSSLFRNKEIKEFLHKVNLGNWVNYSQKEARNLLKLPDNDIIIFFGASNMGDERKGLKHLMEAFHILSKQVDSKLKDQICLVYSSKKKTNALDTIPFKTHDLGFVSFDKQLPLAFVASDAYISPSVMDTGPYMVNMAMGHGCPLISFEVGVAKALVINGQTGFMADNISSEALAQSIGNFLDLTNEELNLMKTNCRQLASEKLSWNKNSLEIFGLD